MEDHDEVQEEDEEEVVVVVVVVVVRRLGLHCFALLRIALHFYAVLFIALPCVLLLCIVLPAGPATVKSRIPYRNPEFVIGEEGASQAILLRRIARQDGGGE